MGGSDPLEGTGLEGTGLQMDEEPILSANFICSPILSVIGAFVMSSLERKIRLLGGYKKCIFNSKLGDLVLLPRSQCVI